MTNRDMVRGGDADPVQKPNAAPPRPMPAPEDAGAPTTLEEPIDSPQPNASAKRDAPLPGEHGLSVKR